MYVKSENLYSSWLERYIGVTYLVFKISSTDKKYIYINIIILY